MLQMNIGNHKKSLIMMYLSKKIYFNFSYGYLTWEWNKENPLRSPLYHLNFSLIFWILKILNIDYPILI